MRHRTAGVPLVTLAVMALSPGGSAGVLDGLLPTGDLLDPLLSPFEPVLNPVLEPLGPLVGGAVDPLLDTLAPVLVPITVPTSSPQAPAEAFDEDLSRYLHQHAMAAYCSPKAVSPLPEAGPEPWTVLGLADCPKCNLEGFRHTHTFYNQRLNIFGYAGYGPALFGDTNPASVVFSFRGTEPASLRSWLEDLATVPVPYFNDNVNLLDILGTVAALDTGVHAGFQAAYLSIREQVLEAVTWFEDHGLGTQDGTDWFVTGHSLGGALAQHAALDMALTGLQRSRVYTYGQPRVGTAGFADLFTASVLATQRVVWNHDIVPQLLPPILYKHAGPEAYYGWDHLGGQGYYLNLCDDPEGSACHMRSALTATLLPDHILYYTERPYYEMFNPLEYVSLLGGVCSWNEGGAEEYNDALARTLFRFADASYSGPMPLRVPEAVDAWNTSGTPDCQSCNIPGFRLTHAFGNASMGVHGYAGYGPSLFGRSGNSVLFAFSGGLVADLRDLLDGLTDTLAALHLPGFEDLGAGEGVQGELQDLYLSMRADVLAAAVWFEDNGLGSQNGATWYTTGHSIGGVLAQHAALDLALTRAQLARVYTFGQPPTGTAAFADLLVSTVRAVHHVVWNNDIVPHLLASLTHAGQEAFYFINAATQRLELHLCSRGDAADCHRRTALTRLLHDHLLYFADGDYFADLSPSAYTTGGGRFVEEPTQSPFDEDRSQELFAFVKASYCSPEAPVLADGTEPPVWASPDISNFHLTHSFFDNTKGFYAGYGLLNGLANAVVFVFRGQLLDLRGLRALIGSLTDEVAPYHLEGFESLKVHRGFQSRYLSLRSRVLEAVRWFEANGMGDDKWFVTGHGLGGALAQLAALDLSLPSGDNSREAHSVSAYTFGSPRVGSEQWANLFINVVEASQRVVWFNDAMAQVPSIGLFQHAGPEAYFRWNQDNGTYTLSQCALPEAVECLAGSLLSAPDPLVGSVIVPEKDPLSPLFGLPVLPLLDPVRASLSAQPELSQLLPAHLLYYSDQNLFDSLGAGDFTVGLCFSGGEPAPSEPFNEHLSRTLFQFANAAYCSPEADRMTKGDFINPKPWESAGLEDCAACNYEGFRLTHSFANAVTGVAGFCGYGPTLVLPSLASTPAPTLAPTPAQNDNEDAGDAPQEEQVETSQYSVVCSFVGPGMEGQGVRGVLGGLSPVLDTLRIPGYDNLGPGEGVNAQLQDMYLSISEEVREAAAWFELNSLGTQNGATWFMTGHSLGGAVAQLAALDLALTRTSLRSQQPSRVYTFGQPRTGRAPSLPSAKFASLLVSALIATHRVVWNADAGVRALSNVLLQHAGPEAHYAWNSATSSYVLTTCTDPESAACHLGTVATPLLFPDSRLYYSDMNYLEAFAPSAWTVGSQCAPAPEGSADADQEPAIPFNDGWARELFSFANAAYCSPQAPALTDGATPPTWNGLGNCDRCEAQGFHLTHSFEGDDCYFFAGFGPVREFARAVVFSFRGEALGRAELVAWLEGLTSTQAPLQFEGFQSANVHQGFQDAYLQCRPRVLEAVQWFEANGMGDDKWFVTGHGLGGALAQLAALDLSLLPSGDGTNDILSVISYTFGSPRVGDELFANLFSNVVEASQRVVWFNDAVAQMPPSADGVFAHAGPEALYRWMPGGFYDLILCANPEAVPCLKGFAMNNSPVVLPPLPPLPKRVEGASPKLDVVAPLLDVILPPLPVQETSQPTLFPDHLLYYSDQPYFDSLGPAAHTTGGMCGSAPAPAPDGDHGPEPNEPFNRGIAAALFKHAAAAYCSPTLLGLSPPALSEDARPRWSGNGEPNCDKCTVTDFRLTHVFNSNDELDIQGYAGYGPSISGDSVYSVVWSFRGTHWDKFNQWMASDAADETTAPYFLQGYDVLTQARFQESYLLIRDQILEAARWFEEAGLGASALEMSDDNLNDSVDWFFTGHSLGGALAQHAALDMALTTATQGHNTGRVYTFGSPRVGSEQWAQLLTNSMGTPQVANWRVVWENDVVPTLPSPTGCPLSSISFPGNDPGSRKVLPVNAFAHSGPEASFVYDAVLGEYGLRLCKDPENILCHGATGIIQAHFLYLSDAPYSFPALSTIGTCADRELTIIDVSTVVDTDKFQVVSATLTFARLALEDWSAALELALRQDLAAALRSPLRYVRVLGVRSGSVVADVEVDTQDPEGTKRKLENGDVAFGDDLNGGDPESVQVSEVSSSSSDGGSKEEISWQDYAVYAGIGVGAAVVVIGVAFLIVSRNRAKKESKSDRENVRQWGGDIALEERSFAPRV